MLGDTRRRTPWWSTLEVIMGELFPKTMFIADIAGNVVADEGTAGGIHSFIPYTTC